MVKDKELLMTAPGEAEPRAPSAYEQMARNIPPSMTEVPFTREEYRRRLQRTRELMAREGVDLLFLQAPESMCYLSGYALTYYGSQPPIGSVPVSGVAVHVDRDDFILFELTMHANPITYGSVANDVRLMEAGTADPVEFVVAELKASGWLPGVIGLEMWSHRPVRAASEMFQAAFEREGCQVVDGTRVVRDVRSVKSPAELACMETAARIADIGLTAAKETLRPGITELELWGETVAAMARAGGENQAIQMLVYSGMKVKSHGLASRKQILPGEIVFVDVCGVYNRYHVDQARCYSIGEPPPEYVRVVNASAGVFDAIQEILRPDLPVREVLERAVSYYKDAGIWDLRAAGTPFGYEMGLSFPPDWVGNFRYSIAVDPGDQSFGPGTVVNHEAQFFMPDLRGYSVIIDTLVFSESEASWTSNVPRELIVV
jgi:Xaa-Pro dipeptidase